MGKQLHSELLFAHPFFLPKTVNRLVLSVTVYKTLFKDKYEEEMKIQSGVTLIYLLVSMEMQNLLSGQQGRTQDVFPGGGGKIIYNIGWKTQTRARSARAGGGCRRGVSPLPHEGAFAFLRLKLNDLVHTFLHIKRLIRPQFLNFCLVSPVNGGVGAWAIVPP